MANSKLMSAYEMAEKDRLDRQAHQEFWENLGEKKGEERGEKKSKIMIARKMLSRNIPVEDIADMTDLSISEIECLH